MNRQLSKNKETAYVTVDLIRQWFHVRDSQRAMPFEDVHFFLQLPQLVQPFAPRPQATRQQAGQLVEVASKNVVGYGPFHGRSFRVVLDEAADGSKNAGEEPGMGRHRRIPLLDSPFLQKVCFASKISVKELCELKKKKKNNYFSCGMGVRPEWDPVY